MVRMWGQRNTAHIYAADDWPLLHTVFRDRESMVQERLREAGSLGGFQRLVSHLEKRPASGERLAYKDASSSDGYNELEKELEASSDRWADLVTTKRGAGWVLSHAAFLHLVRAGVVCHGPNQGAESTFVHRDHWLPDLEWSPPDDDTVFVDLACRYLATYGPATPEISRVGSAPRYRTPGSGSRPPASGSSMSR